VSSNDPDNATVNSPLTGSGGVASNGLITIILDAHPNGTQSFSFNGTNGIGAFTLVDDGTSANTATFSKPAGDYKVTVSALAKWKLIGLTCNRTESIHLIKRNVVIHHTSADVTCTFTESLRRPDALIGTASGGPYMGDGIYASSVLSTQTKNQAIAAGATKSFFVRFDNESLDTDSFKLSATLSGSDKFGVKFFRGAVDITDKVKAGTYKVSGVAPGGQFEIEIRVHASSSTGASAVRNIDLTIKSRSASAARDIVRAHVTRN
jgi:hypothetical protein